MFKYPMNYRAEIDGLRAIAVLSVLFYHSKFTLFSGGFVGVDIFFVISGYLITTIILRELSRNEFNPLKFYERRSRRIIPALYLVLFITTIFGWFILLPDQFESYGLSLIASILFISNIFFWKETNYFAPIASEQPLLHTWSLGVEEQFYLIYPLFLFVLWRNRQDKLMSLLIITAFISLAICEYFWRNSATANFYLLPTRAWEFIVGGITSIAIKSYGVRSNNLASVTGLFLILSSIVFLNNNIPFPSVFTLIPVFGTALVIITTDQNTLTYNVLGNKIMTTIGTLSYSAYLWHQPLFVYAKTLYENTTTFFMFSLCIISFLLAFATWKWVETPFRSAKIVSTNQFIKFFVISSFLLGIIATIICYNNGHSTRYSLVDQQYLSQISFKENEKYVVKKFHELQGAEWAADKKKILLIGDSYAQDLTNAIYEAQLDQEISIVTWYISARCGNLYLPLEKRLQFIKSTDHKMCSKADFYTRRDFHQKIMDADEIWLVSSWKTWQVRLISDSVRNLNNTSKAKVVVFGRKDLPKFTPYKYLGMSPFQRAKQAAPISESKTRLIANMKSKLQHIEFIDTQNLLCGGDTRACKLFDEKGNPKTFDGYHLTSTGAAYLGQQLREFILEQQQ